MLCFEWWAFELLALFSGYMGTEYLAAEVIIINIVSFIFMVPLGISFAASALVGISLGENNIDLSKRFAYMTILFNVFATVIILILLVSCQDGISTLFTNEPKVVKIIADCLHVIVFYVFFDTIHGVQAGIIRGLGLQAYGSVYTLICYYVLGMPLALHFAFRKEMMVTGLWTGFSIACVILDIGFCAIVSCPDWRKIARKYQEMNKKNE